MKINIDDILCEPAYEGRNWHSCNYTYQGQHLFHERSYFPHNVFKEPFHEQWFFQFNLSKSECEEAVKQYGNKAWMMEHFYSEGSYFPAFNDNNTAVEFCRSDVFDRLSQSLDKIDK